MTKYIIPCMMFFLLVGCGSDTSTAANDANANLSASGSTLDAAGTWNVTTTTCTSYPVISSFPVNVESTTSSMQTFAGCAMQQPVTCSEGTLNTQTGDFVLCYSDTLASCAIKCTGTYVADAPMTLTCNELSTGTCTMTVKK